MKTDDDARVVGEGPPTPTPNALPPARRVVSRAARALTGVGRAAARACLWLWRRPTRDKIKAAGVTAAVVVFILVPYYESDADVILLPSSGEEVTLPETLVEGKLYKLIVSGTYIGAGDDRRYDAEFITESDPFDTPRSSVVIDDRLASADSKDPANHRYTYYVAGKGKPARIRLADWMVKDGPRGGYYDNQGYLEMTLEEAEFRFSAEDRPQHRVPGVEFHYTLDPQPRPRDALRLEVFSRPADGTPEKVFDISSESFIDPSLGFPLRLPKETRSVFSWTGVANLGPYAYKPLPPGLYDCALSVTSGGETYYAFPPDARSRYLTVAILPASSDPRFNPQPLIPVDANGAREFPYYSPRATHPILGPIAGIDNIYVPAKEIPNPSFLYYSPAGLDGAPVASTATFYVKRMVNLALSTAAECDPSFEYAPMRGLNGVFDDNFAAALVTFRQRLPYDTTQEELVLDTVDNLPPGRGYAATPQELGCIVGPPTLAHLFNLTFRIDGVNVDLPLREFDNFKAFDESDPRHSLYHTFWEVGKRVCAEKRRWGPPPPGGAADPGKKYDIADADFVALMMAISYQECGFVHTLSDGVCYRVGRGRGSATGYMQCTADLIHGTNYKLTYPTDAGVFSVRMNQLPYNSRYAVRNVARFNVEIGAQFLREMVEQADSQSYGRDFLRETYGAGLLSWASPVGRVNRVKLAGAMYNAGPGSVKVMLTEIYDDPSTRDRNEGVDYFINDCECDMTVFLQRFRKDLYEYSRGRYKFPLQKKGSEGTARVRRLIEWLGVFWVKKQEGISWEEAALIKIDREVVPYVDGVSTNFQLFRKYDASFFRSRNFYNLWQRPKKKELLEGTIRPARPLRRSVGDRK